MIKAAVGGQVSPINGEEYKGGQFMPETGEFCGLGKNRIAKSKLDSINSTLTNCRIEWDSKFEVFALIRLVKMSNGTEVWQRQFSARSLAIVQKCL